MRRLDGVKIPEGRNIIIATTAATTTTTRTHADLFFSVSNMTILVDLTWFNAGRFVGKTVLHRRLSPPLFESKSTKSLGSLIRCLLVVKKYMSRRPEWWAPQNDAKIACPSRLRRTTKRKLRPTVTPFDASLSFCYIVCKL